jgi:hypothetical protein
VGVGFRSMGLIDVVGTFCEGGGGWTSVELFPMGGNPDIGELLPNEGGTGAGGDGEIEDGVPTGGVAEGSGPKGAIDPVAFVGIISELANFVVDFDGVGVPTVDLGSFNDAAGDSIFVPFPEPIADEPHSFAPFTGGATGVLSL